MEYHGVFGTSKLKLRVVLGEISITVCAMATLSNKKISESMTTPWCSQVSFKTEGFAWYAPMSLEVPSCKMTGFRVIGNSFPPMTAQWKILMDWDRWNVFDLFIGARYGAWRFGNGRGALKPCFAT